MGLFGCVKLWFHTCVIVQWTKRSVGLIFNLPDIFVILGNSWVPPGFLTSVVQKPEWSCRRGACQQSDRHSKFLSYLTGAQYCHRWWRGRCQSCNQVPATHGKSRGIEACTHMPPMPRDLPQLRQRTMEAVVATDRQMLWHVWQELDCRIDICHVTKGGHIEHLYGRTETRSVSPSVDMLPFGVTILVSVPQRLEIPEGLTNYPVYVETSHLNRTVGR
jgi:hypothetical protein